MNANQNPVITLTWTGPFTLRELGAPNPPAEAHGLGVYVWAARVETEWWGYYVGLTNKTFAERHREHLSLYDEGQYRIYEPEAFAQGRKVLVWGGAFDPQNRHRLSEFQRRRVDLAPSLEAFIALLYVFLIPMSEHAQGNAWKRPSRVS